MAQNAYDRLDFFTGYSRLPRSIDGLAGAPEWPTLQAMLPNLHKRDVVNPGCGFGWFCRRARQHGAAHILCLELSEKTLESARTPDDAAVTYGDGRPRSALAARCAFRRRQHFARLSPCRGRSPPQEVGGRRYFVEGRRETNWLAPAS